MQTNSNRADRRTVPMSLRDWGAFVKECVYDSERDREYADTFYAIPRLGKLALYPVRR